MADPLPLLPIFLQSYQTGSLFDMLTGVQATYERARDTFADDYFLFYTDDSEVMTNILNYVSLVIFYFSIHDR